MIFGFLNILLFFIFLSCNILVWNEEIVVISLLLISFTTIIVNVSNTLNQSYSIFFILFSEIYNFIFKLFIQFNNLSVGFFIFTKYSYYIILVFTLNYVNLTFLQIINFLKFTSCNFYVWNFFIKCLTFNNTDSLIKSVILANLKKKTIRIY